MTPPRLTITLDRPDRTYLQGERVSGTVTVTTSAPVECRELTVELGHRFSGKRGRGEGTEASAPLFEGSWGPGNYVVPFSLPVKAELPTYDGQLFTITRMIRARALLAHQPAVEAVAIVQIACSPREDGWLDPREQQLPPVAFTVNDAPVRLEWLKRAVERGVGLLLGTRRPASVDVAPRVLVGGGTVRIAVASAGKSRRLPRLRARLLGVEEWPRDGRSIRKVILKRDLAPTVTADAQGTVLRFEVELPVNASSIEPLLRWRIELHGAQGCLDHRDRWQPLWIGPSAASLARLRSRPPGELAAAGEALRVGASSSRLRQGLLAALALLACVVFPVVIVWLSAPDGTRVQLLAWAAGIGGVVAMVVWRKRAVDRVFRESFTRPAAEPAAPGGALPPPSVPLAVEVVRVGESRLPAEVRQRLRAESIRTQRRILRRGTRGLLFLVAVNLLAKMLGPHSALSSGYGVALLLFSGLVIATSLVVRPMGRPLSCYVGFAPLLVVAWLVASIGGAVASAAAAVAERSLPDGSAALLLAAGAAVTVLLARRDDPTLTPGRKLLVLWVFGTSSRMEEIMREVGLQWLYLGPIQYLRGPGSLPQLGRLVAALRGGAREYFADTVPQVMSQLRRFRFRPNTFGIYALNSIQCSDAVWRAALDALVDTTDIVMMDLTAFGRNNRGCAYELGLLLARLPTSRFVLVVDGATDIGQLTALLQESWAAMPPDSPNRQGTPDAVRLFHIPLRGAEPQGKRWLALPMTDLVELLYTPLAEDGSARYSPGGRAGRLPSADRTEST